MVDHVIKTQSPLALKKNPSILNALGSKDELGGSSRVTSDQLQALLIKAGEFATKAGGSAANTLRSLAQGFEVKASLVGAAGADEWGGLFRRSLERAGVDVSQMLTKAGSTGRCAVITSGTERTMRTAMEDAVRLSPDDLRPEHFGECFPFTARKGGGCREGRGTDTAVTRTAGAAWFVLNGYAFYGEGLVEKAVAAARAAGCRVALDMGSFEVVKAYRGQIKGLIDRAEVDLVLCNEDEAAAFMEADAEEDTFKEALRYLVAAGVQTAVVMLGARGCIALQKGMAEPVRHPAFTGFEVVDTTGAGDTFAAGFLYSLIQGSPLARACEVGCLAGGAVVQTLGAEVAESGWRWMNAKMHGELAATVARSSAAAVQKELLHCYSLIAKLGRGVVYYGSARLKQSSPHWDKAVALGREVATLLDCTTWSGGGPGMMEAATRGALEAGKKVGGIRIEREAGQVVKLVQGQHYLPPGTAAFCKYLSPRKVALVDSAVREKADDRTAYIFLPGGLGTMDEFFELLTLIQLKKLGTKHAVPVILASYDGFFDGLGRFMEDCSKNGVVNLSEYSSLKTFKTNEEIVDYLANYYNLPREGPAAKKPRVE